MAGVRRTRKKNGEFYPKWRGWYLDHNHKRKWFTGTEDEEQTLAMAKRLEYEQGLVAEGYRPPPKLADKPRRSAAVVEEYLAWGAAQGGRGHKPWAPEHARGRRRHLEWWIKSLKATLLSDLHDCLPRAEKLLRKLHRDNRAGKTINNYAEAVRAFCRWCVKRKYLVADPLEDLEPYDSEPRKEHRALTLEEARSLLRHCRPEFRLLYETAMTSGLRAGELASVKVVDIDTKNNGIRLKGRWTKNRKGGFQPLPVGLVTRLDAFCKGMGPSELVFDVPTHPGRTLEYDLTLANIPKETEEGVVDFHALRTTFSTLVVESGANAKVAQVMMRHSDPRITMNVYVKVRPDALNDVADTLGAALNGDDPCATRVQHEKGGEGADDVIDCESRGLELVEAGGGGGNRTPVP